MRRAPFQYAILLALLALAALIQARLSRDAFRVFQHSQEIPRHPFILMPFKAVIAGLNAEAAHGHAWHIEHEDAESARCGKYDRRAIQRLQCKSRLLCRVSDSNRFIIRCII